MDIDNPGRSEGSPSRPKANGFQLYPVSVNESGEGLPYAPEDWPHPGDKWVWKVGKRIAVSGFFMDRYLYLPSRFSLAGQGRCFASRLSLELYVQKHFPDVDVDAFFSSFSWKIPSKAYKRGVDYLEISRYQTKTSEHPLSDSPMGGCKAGNRFCSSLDTGEDSVSEIMFCDICCSEPGFCRDCCCILCCRIINKAHGGHSYIRCEASTDGYICGHNCHIDCALRAYMAGTVGGSIGLEAEYYCRRCDSRTDLVSHFTKLLQACESLGSRDDIEKLLNVGFCVLRGSKKTSAHQLLNSIEKAMSKVSEENGR
ncbi:protein OBERON 2-like [Dorcoceras hygrometricum]|uniref:Protein OBERON 2-like n=1 Tax=Dorcoceras hygrometricum TaxID=472368 RepID=A0A2Z7BWT9_9LAMI|nr:protein OBERON 2-like [Dorcoceras hygrometricum]